MTSRCSTAPRLRISLGIASNFADVERLLQFAAGLLES